MLTPEEFKAIMQELILYSYDTEAIADEDESTYSPSDTVCNIENIQDILKKFTLPF